jgi:hypothetical protein
MKRQLRIALAGVSLVLLYGCATPGRGGAALAGTWTNALGTIWTINADGTFEVDRNHDGKIDIRGGYSVKGDTFTIEHNEGKVPKKCEGPGVYKFQHEGNNLTFTLVSDDCKDRKKNVLSPWHMK